MRTLAHRHDVGVSRKQFVAMTSDFFLVDPHRSLLDLARSLGTRGNEAQILENGRQSSARSVDFDELLDQILRHAAMHPGGEITLRVFRGRGRMEPRDDLPRQLEFHVPWVPALRNIM